MTAIPFRSEELMAIIAKSAAPSAHWYTAEGAPAHRQFKADGGERPTTLADARKLGLFPSVTSILGTLAKPGLENWKIDQALQTALKSPKTDEETVEYYCKRIRSASMEQVETAADLGTRIHNNIDSVFDGRAPEEDLLPYISPVAEWVAKTGIVVTDREEVVVSIADGYAGRMDCAFSYGKKGKGMIDWKSRKTRPGEKVTPYEGQGMQLAAYSAVYYGVDALKDVLLANVYVSSTEPGRLDICKHEDPVELYETFRALCAVWRHLKGYDPRKQVAHV